MRVEGDHLVADIGDKETLQRLTGRPPFGGVSPMVLLPTGEGTFVQFVFYGTTGFRFDLDGDEPAKAFSSGTRRWQRVE